MDLKKASQIALDQIEEKEYATELHARGIEKILSLGIGFEGKKVHIRSSANYKG